MPDKPIPQAGAIPYRTRDDGAIEVCLVTARSGGWTIPKGGIDPGKTAHDMAQIEALEEAGLIGETEPRPFGNYEYTRESDLHRVQVFAMLVDRELERWDEMGFRTREWLPIERAADRVRFDDLGELIRRFAAQRG